MDQGFRPLGGSYTAVLESAAIQNIFCRITCVDFRFVHKSSIFPISVSTKSTYVSAFFWSSLLPNSFLENGLLFELMCVRKYPRHSCIASLIKYSILYVSDYLTFPLFEWLIIKISLRKIVKRWNFVLPELWLRIAVVNISINTCWW